MNGHERIAAERVRQITEEGWKDDHQYVKGELVQAARAYAAVAGMPVELVKNQHTADQVGWPWDLAFWKPTGDAIRDLEKAGALIAAEIDRLLHA